MLKTISAVLAVSCMLVAGPAGAQEAPAEAAPAAASQAAAPAAGQATETAAQPAAPACELHIWPTYNYLGVNTGLISGFGLIGALVDDAVHKDRVQSVKDYMRDYLGPEVQMAELDRIGLLKSLGLPDTYRVIVEEPTPFHDDLKTDPALKARAKEMNDKIKANRRLTASQSPCYVELITTMIFYHKAMMYGSNLFTGWIYRDFGDQAIARKVATGSVKNPLELFPPKDTDQVKAAQVEIRDAYAKNYAEWLVKKKSNAAAPKAAAGRASAR